jgi:CheY-like chemotaxis protein
MLQNSILIVEDDPNICELIQLTLDKGEYSFVSADTGSEALHKIAGEKPDLVILDILMPEPDGWKVYETIRRDPALSQTRVLILTALPIKPDILAEKHLLPADRFMTKPFELDDLRMAVRDLLEDTQC